MYCLGGVSIQGSYHDINQDSFQYKEFPFGYVLVLSDGVGSCKNSQYGSKALCNAVICLAEKYECNIKELSENTEEFLNELHNHWLEGLGDKKIQDCYCTALFVIIKGNRYISFHLGDGLLSVLSDDSCIVSLEEKLDYVNITEAMSEVMDIDKWQIETHEVDVFQGVILASDGLELAKYEKTMYENFSRELFGYYKDKNKAEIEENINEWLADWPSCDDKTIAFMFLSDVGEA